MSDFRVADWLARELGSAGRGAVLRNLVHEDETVRGEYEVPGQPGIVVVICHPQNGIGGLTWEVRAYLNDPATSPIARTKTGGELILGGAAGPGNQWDGSSRAAPRP
jgi:hypothetical protein